MKTCPSCGYLLTEGIDENDITYGVCDRPYCIFKGLRRYEEE